MISKGCAILLTLPVLLPWCPAGKGPYFSNRQPSSCFLGPIMCKNLILGPAVRTHEGMRARKGAFPPFSFPSLHPTPFLPLSLSLPSQGQGLDISRTCPPLLALSRTCPPLLALSRTCPPLLALSRTCPPVPRLVHQFQDLSTIYWFGYKRERELSLWMQS